MEEGSPINTEPTPHAAPAFPTLPDQIPLFLGSRISAVLAGLQQDLDGGRHLLCVTGPQGVGKTALARELHRTCGREMASLVEAPTPDALVFDLLASFAISVPERDPAVARRRLCLALASGNHRQQPLLQIVDDADRLTPQDLATLLHLFPRGFAQIILLGTPDFARRFQATAQAKGLPTLDCVYRLKPLSLSDTGQYVRHRLGCADLPKELFRQNAIAAVYAYSSGTPGLINRLCSAALAAAPRMTESSITDVQIHAAARLAAPGTYHYTPRDQSTAAGNAADRIQHAPTTSAARTPAGDGGRGATSSPRLRPGRTGWAGAAVAAAVIGALLLTDHFSGPGASPGPAADHALNGAPAAVQSPPAASAGRADFAALRAEPTPGTDGATGHPARTHDLPVPARPPEPPADSLTRPDAAQPPPERRAEAPRLHAVGAEHEVAMGDRGAAHHSIVHGLANEPANTRLRELRREPEDQPRGTPSEAAGDTAAHPVPAPPPSISPDIEQRYEAVVQDAEVRFYTHLARSALDSGDPVEALSHIAEGLDTAPHDRTLLELRSATLATLATGRHY